MNKLDTNCTAACVKHDVIKVYVEICLLIGKQLINNGIKNHKLVGVAEQLLQTYEKMDEYASH